MDFLGNEVQKKTASAATETAFVKLLSRASQKAPTE